MPIDVRGPDGTIYRVNTDDENVARETVRRALREQRPRPENRPRSSNPTGRRPNANTISEGNAQFSRAYARERQRQEAIPRAPGLGWTDQMFRNIGVGDELAEASAFVGQGLENIGRRLTGQPIDIPVSTAVEAADRYQRNAQERFARENPGQNALSVAASILALAGNPAALPQRVTALQGGLAAAGTNAPFALARQEGDLTERLPGAATETAIVGAAGTGLQAFANRMSRPLLGNTTAGRMQDFDQAGVRAPLAAVQGRAGAPMAMAIAENPIGGNVRRHLQNSVDDVQAASQRLTQQIGTPEPREIAGEIVQRGVQRFSRGNDVPQPRGGDPRTIPVRDWSFGAKSRALYDRVFERLGADEAAMVDQVDGPLLMLDNTRQTLATIQGRVSGEASREVMRNTFLDDMASALEDDVANGTLRFRDLREWRTRVREAQRNEGLRQGIDNAALQRVEAALTRDIYESAINISPGAAQDLRAVDRWYRTINSRIENALQRFAAAPGNPGASAYRRVIALASQGGQQNTRALRQLRASLRPDEWRTLSATIADELGNPSFGNPTVLEPSSFSIENFVTNYARLSDEGRQLLFGANRVELDRLARVAGNLKGVRGFANASRSGSSLQNIGTIGTAGTAFVAAGTGNIAPLAGLAAAGLTARITGEMLTNPAFVRWLTSANAGGMRRQLAALATIAARDPAIAPLYTELAQHGYAQVRPQPDQGAPRSAPPQEHIELAQ